LAQIQQQSLFQKTPVRDQAVAVVLHIAIVQGLAMAGEAEVFNIYGLQSD
jgi:hypothetical protein